MSSKNVSQLKLVSRQLRYRKYNFVKIFYQISAVACDVYENNSGMNDSRLCIKYSRQKRFTLIFIEILNGPDDEQGQKSNFDPHKGKKSSIVLNKYSQFPFISLCLSLPLSVLYECDQMWRFIGLWATF